MGDVRHLKPVAPVSAQKVTVTMFFDGLSKDIGEFSDEFERIAKRFGALERPLLTIITASELAADPEYQFVRGARTT